jgi:hypothetical protein
MSYNTSTGSIKADVGWAGGSGLTCTATQCSGTATAGATFTIHNVHLNYTGSIVMISWTTCISGTCIADDNWAWVAGTTTVYESEATKTSGHSCMGSLGMLNGPGSPIWQWYYRTLPNAAAPGSPVAVNTLPVPNQPTNLDSHCGWQMDNTNDTAPFQWSSTTNSLGTWGLLPFDQPTGPWWSEIDFTDTNGDGLTHREAMTFNTGYSTTFSAQNNITTASNKCVAVGSDWFNIRNAGGTSTTCIPNGPNWKASYTYPVGYVINPTVNNSADDSFEATAGGVAGSSDPNWGTSCATTCTDGGVLWTNIGAPSGVNACGTDVFAWCFLPPSQGVLGTSPMFGFTETSTNNNIPSVSYGMQRFWDSPPLQWPSLNPSAGSFTFTNLDTALANDYSNGITEGMYTLARTPPWITSQPGDSTTCDYGTGAVGGGNGECFAPSDLNGDGSGTNATWKAWVTKIAQHANGQDGNPTYLTNHAHIRYWEPWNEPDASAMWHGSIAQLARLTEDARCIITGIGVIHQSGDGTATPCTATAIDPTAKIIMSAAHATSQAVLTYGQNELYCNNTGGIPSYELPCPNPPNAIAAAVDVINYHLKPGNTTGYSVEGAMAFYMSKIRAYLQPAELAKPFWDGEMSYAIAGFTGAYTDPDMAASFLPRMYLTMWSLGINGAAFYSWDSLKVMPVAVQTAYQQTYNWLAGSLLTSPCAASGTVYSCSIVKSGQPYSIMWDTSKSCSGGICTTGNQPVAGQWGHVTDMTTAGPAATISGQVVSVGIKPVVMSQ